MLIELKVRGIFHVNITRCVTFREDRLLASQLFQHLGGSCQSVTRLADTDVETELVDSELPHDILLLLFLLALVFVLKSCQCTFFK